MPFVNIQILEGHRQKRKDVIGKRGVEAISELAKLPRHAVWAVSEDITADDWHVEGRSLRKIRPGKK